MFDTETLERFAETVLELANACPACDRFGESKVYLSAVRASFESECVAAPGFFDAALIEANRRGLLRLSRADLTTAMDCDKLAASEIQCGLARWHFVRMA